MTPDNYKQSFTDDFNQEESCKIKKKKKKFLKLDKKIMLFYKEFYINMYTSITIVSVSV